MAKKATESFYKKCAVCGRLLVNVSGDSTIKDPILHLSIDACMCKWCENKIRVMYPVSYRVLKKGYNASPIDALKEISLDEYDELVKKAGEYRESLREKYNWCDAVFQVEYVVISKGGLFSAPMLNVYGHTLYGSFNYFDTVRMIHEGSSIDAEIKSIGRNIQEGYPEFLSEKPGKVEEEIKKSIESAAEYISSGTKTREKFIIAEEGYPYVLRIQSKNTSLKPGDLIVKGGRQ